MKTTTHIRLALTLISFGFPSFGFPLCGGSVKVAFIPGFLESGPQQAADRAKSVQITECSLERVGEHGTPLPDNARVDYATMSEFRKTNTQKPFVIRYLAATITVFMRHFWPWYTRRTGRRYIITGVVPSYDMDITDTDIGGLKDIEAVTELLDKEDMTHDLVFGVSRGSSASFVALAQRATQGKSLPKAVVLESPFAQFSDVRPSGLGGKLADLVHAPNTTEQDSIAYVSAYPKEVPTLFVTSEQDDKVPAVSVRNLAQTLADAGHDQVYLLVLKNATHKDYTSNNRQDWQKYTNVARAFYQKVGLTHDEKSTVNLDDYKVQSSI